MWRLRNTTDGRRAYAVVVPHGAKATAGWFSQGIPQESFDFPTWHDALCWLEAKLNTLQRHGWRVEEPPSGKPGRPMQARPKNNPLT